MKRIRESCIIACVGIGLILGACGGRERKETPFHNAPKYVNALQSFARDHAAAGGRLPLDVSLQDLLRGGYLRTDDVAALDGLDVAFFPEPDGGNPQMILARARTSDGRYICLLGDGSVQQLSRERYEQQRTLSGQPAGATDGRQPVHPETNRVSEGVGSRH